MFTVKTPTLVTALTLSALVACSSGEEQAKLEPTRDYRQTAEPATPAELEAPVASVQTEWNGGGTEIHDIEGADTPSPVDVVPRPDGDYFTVQIRHGENLVAIADLAGTSVDEIADLNQLDDFDSLFVGQEIYIPIPEDEGGVNSDAFVVSFDEAREEALAERVDRFQTREGGLAEVRTHRVATGENAWTLATAEFGVPLWVLAHYNPEVDLERLRIGQQLQYPMLQSAMNTQTDPVLERSELAKSDDTVYDVVVGGDDSETSEEPPHTASLPVDLLIEVDPTSGNPQVQYLIYDFDLNAED